MNTRFNNHHPFNNQNPRLTILFVAIWLERLCPAVPCRLVMIGWRNMVVAMIGGTTKSGGGIGSGSGKIIGFGSFGSGKIVGFGSGSGKILGLRLRRGQSS